MDESYYLFKLNFHGKLEIPADSVTNYDKEQFLKAVKEKVSYYGLQKYLDVPTANVTMNNLVLYYCFFKLDAVIKSY